MKIYSFLTTLGFLLTSNGGFSQTTPSFEFSPSVASKLIGPGSVYSPKRFLNCSTLLTKNWSYPNAQVTGFCYEAETACLRYDLMLLQVKKAQGAPELEKFKSGLPFALKDVELKLHGCQLAIEASFAAPGFLHDLVKLFNPKESTSNY